MDLLSFLAHFIYIAGTLALGVVLGWYTYPRVSSKLQEIQSKRNSSK